MFCLAVGEQMWTGPATTATDLLRLRRKPAALPDSAHSPPQKDPSLVIGGAPTDLGMSRMRHAQSRVAGEVHRGSYRGSVHSSGKILSCCPFLQSLVSLGEQGGNLQAWG